MGENVKSFENILKQTNTNKNIATKHLKNSSFNVVLVRIVIYIRTYVCICKSQLTLYQSHVGTLPYTQNNEHLTKTSIIQIRVRACVRIRIQTI